MKLERGQAWIFKSAHEEYAHSAYLVLSVNPSVFHDGSGPTVTVLDLMTGRQTKFWEDSFTALAKEIGTLYP